MKIFNRWNKHLLLPELRAVQTTAMLFDPEGSVNPQNHRWIGYAVRYNATDILSKQSDFNHDVVNAILNEATETIQDPKQKDIQQQQKVIDELNIPPSRISKNVTSTTGVEHDSGLDERNKKNKKINKSLRIIECFDIFTILPDKEGKQRKYLITIDQGQRYILRCVALKPTTAMERDNPTTIKYPVTFDHYSPSSYSDPIGINVFDLVEDKQAMHSTLINIMAKLVEKNHTGTIIAKKGTLLAENLQYATDHAIEVDMSNSPTQSINELVSFMPQQKINIQDVAYLIDKFEAMVDRGTGIDANVIGQSDDNDRLLGEIKQLQNNANLRLKNGRVRTLEDRKTMWELWYKEYKRNFTGGSKEQKKTINIQVGSSTILHDLTQNDFDSEYPIIEIRSMILDTETQDIRYRTLYQLLPQIQALGDPIAFRETMREIMRTSGSFDDDEIDKFVPRTSEEELIEKEIDILTQNIPIPLIPNSDIQSRMSRQMNIPTDAGRRRAIELLAMAESMGLTDNVMQEVRPENLEQSKEVQKKGMETMEQDAVKEGLSTASL